MDRRSPDTQLVAEPGFIEILAWVVMERNYASLDLFICAQAKRSELARCSSNIAAGFCAVCRGFNLKAPYRINILLSGDFLQHS
jgi:hypothetical protein